MALSGVVLYASPLLAQEDCEEEPTARKPLEVMPASGAINVTIDAPLSVRYSRGYFGPAGPGDLPETLVRVVRCPSGTFCGIGCMAEDGVDVPGTVQVIGDRLFFVPDGGFEPETTYVGRATGVDDVLDFRFCTGASPDLEPPRLGAFLDAEPAETTAACVLPEGGRLVGLRWEQARDDGPAGSIEYLLRDRLRNYASPEVTLNLRLDAEEASEPVCVRMFAQDGVGHVSESSPEQCFDPVTSAAFQPLCAARAPGPASPWVLGLMFAIGAALGFRRWRR
jgi:hypothetical protein